MKIKGMVIEGLFEDYNYNLDFFVNQKVTILTGINGVGKTTIFKLIQAILEGDILYLDKIPFKTIELVFENSDSIKVTKRATISSILDLHITEIVQEQSLLELTCFGEYAFKQDGITIYDTMGLSQQCCSWIEGMLKSLMEYNKVYKGTLRELLKHYKYKGSIFEQLGIAIQLDEYKKNVSIHVIESNRIYIHNEKKQNDIERIKVYSNELSELIRDRRRLMTDREEISNLVFKMEAIDIIIAENEKSILDIGQIQQELKKLDDKRRKIGGLGLLPCIQEGDIDIPLGKSISVEGRKILTYYIERYRSDLNIYDELIEKVELFLDIINVKHGFINKTMKVSETDGIFFERGNGKRVALETLSSGEKNDVILFYYLIFKCTGSSIVLIDEPEISLHICWQQEYIRVLLKICKLNNIQAIIATHSPSIIDDYWELTINLGDQVDG